MTDVERFAEALQKHLRPASFPVAIKMLKEGEPIPDRVKRPAQDLGFQSAICQGFAIARRYGWPIAIGRDDLSCPLAKAVFGFAPMLDYYQEGHACAGMYTETPEAGQRTEAATPKFEYGEYQYIVLAPIHRCTFEPDVVLIYGTPGQVMRLVTAALWQRGGRIASSFSGRIDCADAVIETMKTGEPQVILPCYGDRIFAQTEDHEMAFAVPAARMDELIAGLEGTHKGGVRYPIPSFLRYTGKFPPTYEKMNELWTAQEAESE
ncbi:MAG: hypothetical protein D6791_18635 [Chloroflexi bacterium]|nr:MAG: hypothetical protein D6791_18635 [Chloroflexota bacterium]